MLDTLSRFFYFLQEFIEGEVKNTKTKETIRIEDKRAISSPLRSLTNLWYRL